MLAAVERKQDVRVARSSAPRGPTRPSTPRLIQREFGVKAFKAAGRGKGPRYQYEFYRLYTSARSGRRRVVVLGIDAFMFDMP